MSAANLERRKNSTITIPIFSGGQSGISSTGKAPEKIRFVAADDFPPFVFRDSEQRLMGYNIDLAREICQNLKIACSLEIRPFGHLANTVVNGEADAIIAGLTITPDILNQLQFSRVYMRFPGRFVITKNSSLNPLPDTMESKKIAVVIGSRHEAFLERFFQDAIPVPFDSEELARKAIISSEVDALFGDGMRLSFWLDTKAAESCCKFAGGPWLDPGYFGGGLAIATKAGNTKTLNAINLGLSRLQTNGRLGELYLRYFPRGFF
ncbi:transporter substrate-binding domain-containing protein [Pseudovibrio sp. Tun.PSC04-5.I4]|uniref:transporter substrate-binding domain-containing protein n=1 Tax=Pseudovibrio sp. Tun.PSC04-5.I4 TaxID=1798213 RepID=UPI001AD8EDFF|nr:transporter substrate-binding domain-containing protein [Pseudovibrio sp. Tun.PSC04-5.I4]